MFVFFADRSGLWVFWLTHQRLEMLLMPFTARNTTIYSRAWRDVLSSLPALLTKLKEFRKFWPWITFSLSGACLLRGQCTPSPASLCLLRLSRKLRNKVPNRSLSNIHALRKTCWHFVLSRFNLRDRPLCRSWKRLRTSRRNLAFPYDHLTPRGWVKRSPWQVRTIPQKVLGEV